MVKQKQNWEVKLKTGRIKDYRDINNVSFKLSSINFIIVKVLFSYVTVVLLLFAFSTQNNRGKVQKYITAVTDRYFR